MFLCRLARASKVLNLISLRFKSLRACVPEFPSCFVCVGSCDSWIVPFTPRKKKSTKSHKETRTEQRLNQASHQIVITLTAEWISAI